MTKSKKNTFNITRIRFEFNQKIFVALSLIRDDNNRQGLQSTRTFNLLCNWHEIEFSGNKCWLVTCIDCVCGSIPSLSWGRIKRKQVQLEMHEDKFAYGFQDWISLNVCSSKSLQNLHLKRIGTKAIITLHLHSWNVIAPLPCVQSIRFHASVIKSVFHFMFLEIKWKTVEEFFFC
jgi:hypothetical protein